MLLETVQYCIHKTIILSGHHPPSERGDNRTLDCDTKTIATLFLTPTPSPENPECAADDDGSRDDAVAHQLPSDEIFLGVPGWLQLDIIINGLHS